MRIAKIYANLIAHERKTIKEVPDAVKNQVYAELIDKGKITVKDVPQKIRKQVNELLSKR